MSSNSYENVFSATRDVKPAAFEVYTPQTPGVETTQAEPVVFDGNMQEVSVWQPPSLDVVHAQPPQETFIEEETEETEITAQEAEGEATSEATEGIEEEGAEPQPDVEAIQAQHQIQLEALETTLKAPYENGAKQFEEAVFTLSRQVHMDVVRLAKTLAEHVIKREVSMDETMVEDVVKRALTSAGPLEKATIYCNEGDLPVLQDRLRSLQSIDRNSIVALDLASSDEVQPGGCLLQFDEGTVDARLEAQLARLSESVEAALLGPKVKTTGGAE